ncbi:hypothetical protein K488DRAFT_38916, partial [Vararia minispora EC-137]
MGDDFSDVEVSLEPQLVESLVQISTLLPSSLASLLAPHLSPSGHPGSMAPTIPYSVLLDISKWTRTDEGGVALHRHSPSLSPASYSMITLLAGTRTSPNRVFPPAPPLPAADMRREVNDRRVIAAVINALVSIVGAGVAAWYAAHSVGWRDEWKIIVALLVSTAVAVSEFALYLIWESR